MCRPLTTSNSHRTDVCEMSGKLCRCKCFPPQTSLPALNVESEITIKCQWDKLLYVSKILQPEMMACAITTSKWMEGRMGSARYRRKLDTRAYLEMNSFWSWKAAFKWAAFFLTSRNNWLMTFLENEILSWNNFAVDGPNDAPNSPSAARLKIYRWNCSVFIPRPFHHS